MRISDWSSDVCSSDLQDVAVTLGEDGVHAVLGAGSLDAGPFLSGDATEAEAPAPAPSSFEPLSISAPHLRVLYFAEERRLEQVNLQLLRGLLGWETIRVSGRIPQGDWSPRESPAPGPRGLGGETCRERV